MNTNQKAIELLEQNNIEAALRIFRKAVLENRDVQSLTNLAWVYLHEENEIENALTLVQEAIDLSPKSHFPFSLCGEVLLKMEKYKESLNPLLTSVSIQPSSASYHNLGVAKYYLGDPAEAAKYFGLAAGKSDFTLYNQVKCLIESGQFVEAKKILTTFNENDEDFIGEVDLAELYAELELFEEAVHWYDKGWESYYKQPDWISWYVHSLIKTNQKTRAQEIINEVIQLKIEELNEAHEETVDEDWSDQDKQENIIQLSNEIKEYQTMIERVSAGVLPHLTFEPSPETGCYLFGCKRHGHPEYED
jgi:tetratricopeptide (TPR) repeat protein